MTFVQTLVGSRRGDRFAGTGRPLRRGFLRLRLSLAAGIDAASPITVALVLALALSAYFALLPGVDLAVSDLFHDPSLGFVATTDPALRALRKSSSWVMGLTLLALIVIAVRGWWTAWREARKALFLISGLALASGLVVNGVFKSSWGRARPIQIEAFGGEAEFTRAWAIADQCASNCSFVSGEASSAAWIAAVAVVMTPQPWRVILIPAVFAYAAALSFNRLLFGGHFLSDIVLSWAITALVLCLLHRLMLHCPVAARRARRRRRARPSPFPGMAWSRSS
jgi:membrane-associated phospholipid phosphatase